MKKHKRLKITLICIAVVMVIIVAAGIIYVNDYYHADSQAVEAMESNDQVTVTQLDDSTYVFSPTEDTQTGFIFYPGGKVDYRAYAPLMQACAQKGILCVLVEMPCNLAVLDVNAADGIQEQLPEITQWYIGGHSLGGSMAAHYLAKHTEAYQGLVLLGAYSVDDLRETDLSVVTIYGTEDQVLNQEKYQKNLVNLPENFEEYILTGGCHAYYGMYGAQKGDGTPSITNQGQIDQTAELIRNLTMESDD